uniref:Uncharacterized protein n=1 Tax=Anopheles darlingi TaxID=43151 RepID=A0A2M4DNG0_ANODA
MQMGFLELFLITLVRESPAGGLGRPPETSVSQFQREAPETIIFFLFSLCFILFSPISKSRRSRFGTVNVNLRNSFHLEFIYFFGKHIGTTANAPSPLCVCVSMATS